MKVFVDSKERPEWAQFSPEQIWDALRSELSENGTLVDTISVDGVPVEHDSFLKVTQGRVVLFTTATVIEMMQDSFDSALELIPRLRVGVRDLAVRFETGEIVSCSEALAEMFGAMEWLGSVHSRAIFLMPVYVTKKISKNHGSSWGKRYVSFVKAMEAAVLDKKLLQVGRLLRTQAMKLLDEMDTSIRYHRSHLL